MIEKSESNKDLEKLASIISMITVGQFSDRSIKDLGELLFVGYDFDALHNGISDLYTKYKAANDACLFIQKRLTNLEDIMNLALEESRLLREDNAFLKSEIARLTGITIPMLPARTASEDKPEQNATEQKTKQRRRRHRTTAEEFDKVWNPSIPFRSHMKISDLPMEVQQKRILWRMIYLENKSQENGVVRDPITIETMRSIYPGYVHWVCVAKIFANAKDALDRYNLEKRMISNEFLDMIINATAESWNPPQPRHKKVTTLPQGKPLINAKDIIDSMAPQADNETKTVVS